MLGYKPSDRPTSVFISYRWESPAHCKWVRRLASRLRRDGVETTLDQWDTAPGDQLPAFMERAVRDNDYVVIVCTPPYKQRSDAREGGVGYEGDIMTAEVLAFGNHRKFIPVLRNGRWTEAAPSWLLGSLYVDLRGRRYGKEQYQQLLSALRGSRPQAPPVGRPWSGGGATTKSKILLSCLAVCAFALIWGPFISPSIARMRRGEAPDSRNLQPRAMSAHPRKSDAFMLGYSAGASWFLPKISKDLTPEEQGFALSHVAEAVNDLCRKLGINRPSNLGDPFAYRAQLLDPIDKNCFNLGMDLILTSIGRWIQNATKRPEVATMGKQVTDGLRPSLLHDLAVLHLNQLEPDLKPIYESRTTDSTMQALVAFVRRAQRELDELYPSPGSEDLPSYN